MKIDILEAYIWISEVFRMKSAFYRSTEGLPEPPGGLMGHSGPLWRRGEAARAGRARPHPLVRIGQAGGRCPPLSFLLPPLLIGQGKGGSPTPGRSRTPPACLHRAGRTPQTFSNSASCPKGAHQPHVGWCASFLWPIRPITSPEGFR